MAHRARVALDRALAGPLPRAATRRAAAEPGAGRCAPGRHGGRARRSGQPPSPHCRAIPIPLLLSAALARRTGDLARAHGDVEAAWDLVPDDPLVLLEAGRVALAAGAPGDAAVAWRRVVKRGVDDAATAEARDGLTRLGLSVE